jgi:hypothetical protein
LVSRERGGTERVVAAARGWYVEFSVLRDRNQTLIRAVLKHAVADWWLYSVITDKHSPSSMKKERAWISSRDATD